MTLAQLDEVLKLKPDLLNQMPLRLDVYHQAATRARTRTGSATANSRVAYLDRLEKFVNRLDPVHNPLKAHVLFHRLAFDRAEGSTTAAGSWPTSNCRASSRTCATAWNERPESQPLSRPSERRLTAP